MRKKVLGLIMAALTISTFGAFAQTENNAPSTEQTVCNKDKKECKKKGDKKKCNKGERKGKGDLFKGIELTADQQTQIDALKAERKAKKEESRKIRQEEKKQERKEFDSAVEKILTPEQYALYQSNCEKMKENKAYKAKAKVNKMKEGKNKKAASLKSESVK